MPQPAPGASCRDRLLPLRTSWRMSAPRLPQSWPGNGSTRSTWSDFRGDVSQRLAMPLNIRSASPDSRSTPRSMARPTDCGSISSPIPPTAPGVAVTCAPIGRSAWPILFADGTRRLVSLISKLIENQVSRNAFSKPSGNWIRTCERTQSLLFVAHPGRLPIW